MNIYIINLKTANNRREFQENQLQKLGLTYKIISATTVDDIDNVTYAKHYYDWQRPMRKTEVACYFSHQKLWHQIIKDNKPALILEDDALLSKYLPNLLKRVTNRADIEMINLEVNGRKKFISKSFENIDSHKLYQLLQDRSGSAAYILYPSGAKKLLVCEQKNGIALADAHIVNCKLNALQVEPAMAVQLACCENYHILINGYENLLSSSVSKKYNNKGSLVFRLKRILSQFILAFRQIFIILKGNQRRFISLNKKDFL